MAWSGFTRENIGQYGYGTDLNPLSQQTGIARDDLAAQRDAFLQPLESQFRQQRTASGTATDATSQNALNSPEFASFLQGGSPTTQPSQAAPATNGAPQASPRDTALQQVSQTYTSAQQQPQFLSGIRDALMSQLGQAQQPVNANDSQLAPIAQAMRLENQRAAERKRSALAAQLNHPDMNLGDSGAFDAGVMGILQSQGEANARGMGELLSGELGRRGTMLQNLLSQGLQSGESEANRGLSQFQGNQADARYYAGLGQDQNQFIDRTAFDYNALQQQGNLQALLSILNAAG